MATPAETAEVKAVFDALGAILGKPETAGLRVQIHGGSERAQLVSILHSQLFAAHQLAAAILGFDRAEEATPGGPLAW